MNNEQKISGILDKNQKEDFLTHDFIIPSFQ